jgi:hypothetical protein
MKWYKKADSHGNTLHGDMLRQARERLSEEIKDLKEGVLVGGPKVAQRFHGELKHRIIRLPPIERIPRLSMSELDELSVVVSGIQADVKKYGT